ncbi:hypothetical protein M3Y97_00445300 [Aphelenchoides bicaudatus]|nr:hypothetical protein M3Y97_00445300 [Aphelenchoides bicaudatus]
MFPIELFTKHDKAAGIVGLVANLVLLYMALKRMSPAFRNYSYMILINCANDIIYSIVSLSCGRVIELRNATLFHMSYSLENHASPTVAMFIEFMNEVVCMQTSTILGTQYYFRYILVSKRREPTLGLLSFLVSVSTLASLIFGVTDIFSSMDSAKRGRSYYTEQLGFDWVASDGRIHFSSANDIRDFSTKVHFGEGTVCIFASYAVVMYYGYKTLMIMQNPVPNQQISKNTRAMTRQFTINLLIQTGLTVCCAVMPATYLFVYVVFQPPIPFVGIFISSIYTWNPLSNALVTMLVIKPYREQLVHFISLGRWGSKAKTSVIRDFTSKNSMHRTVHSDDLMTTNERF